jgi:hypothetical protein
MRRKPPKKIRRRTSKSYRVDGSAERDQIVVSSHLGGGSGHAPKPFVEWLPSPNCASREGKNIDALLQEVMAAGKPVPSKILSPPWASALDHLTGCDPCRTLLATCLPSEARKREFETFLGKRLSREVAHS